MNLEELYIPAPISHLMSEALGAKRRDFEGSLKGEVKVEERLLVDLFLLAGAVLPSDLLKMNKNELGDRSRASGVAFVSDNQSTDGVIPKVIVEEWQGNDENLVRVIMNYKNQTLKDVAERYGGKSGAANLANFMAKSNAELAAMRDSTLRKLADALECPVDWLFAVREISGNSDPENASV